MSHVLSCQKLLVTDIEKRAAKVLAFVQHLAKLSPKVVFGDGVEHVTKDTPEIKAFNRRVAADGITLLKNSGPVLPLRPGQKIAVIGPVSALSRK